MRCSGCGAVGHFKTVRQRDAAWNETFALCDSCWEPIRGEVWIRPGPISVTSRCDRCGHYVHPHELVTSRPGGAAKRDVVSTGICVSCAG